MTFVFAAFMLAAAPTQTVPAPAPAAVPAPAPATPPAPTAPAVPASGAKFTLDTPIETLVADPAAKAVLAADLHADITANPSYEMFKGMSFNQIQPYAPDKLPADLLTKIATDLAAIK